MTDDDGWCDAASIDQVCVLRMGKMKRKTRGERLRGKIETEKDPNLQYVV